jgi:hypothetical protein
MRYHKGKIEGKPSTKKNFRNVSEYIYEKREMFWYICEHRKASVGRGMRSLKW